MVTAVEEINETLVLEYRDVDNRAFVDGVDDSKIAFTSFDLLGVAKTDIRVLIMGTTGLQDKYLARRGDKLEGYISEPDENGEVWVLGRKQGEFVPYGILGVVSRNKIDEVFEHTLELVGTPLDYFVSLVKI